MANIDLRTYVIVDSMQPQYAAVTGTVVKGDICMAGMTQLYLEIGPGSGVYRLMDAALKRTGVRPGFQIVEREYGEIELHSYNVDDVKEAGQVMLEVCGMRISDRMRPKVISEQIISNVNPYQAQLINRDNRYGSVLVPGESLYIMEVEPAAYVSLAVNEAEKNADIKLITFDPVGRTGKLYISGTESEVRMARDAVLACINSIDGRD